MGETAGVQEVMETAVDTAMNKGIGTAMNEIGRLVSDLLPWLAHNVTRLIVAIVLLVVGVRVIRTLRKSVRRSMERAGLEITLRKFLDALFYAASLGLLCVIAAETLGINTTSVVAAVGAVGLAMGLAMQDTLANFAGGVLILFLKPFKVGDYIVTAAGEGNVESIGLVYTTIMTIDNRKIVVPNNTVANSPLTNTTGAEKRRLILDIGISYDSDIRKAKEVLERLCGEYPAVLKDEGIATMVTELGAHGVNVSVRAWVNTTDYWQTRWDLLERVKLAFDEENIDITYNRLNVHVKELPERADDIHK